jgi:sporulation protein YlmC with PRC-barrel domain
MSETTQTLGVWTGRQVLDTTGEKIGTVHDVLYDDTVDRPEWLVVKTGLFGTKKVLVPAGDVRLEGEKLMVPYTHDRAKQAPSVDNEEAISEDEKRELYLYYGLEFPEPAGMTPPAATTSPTPPGEAEGTEGKWGPGIAPDEQEEILIKRREQ